MTMAITAMIDGRELPPPAGVSASYNGLPTAQDIARFRAKGGRIISCRDILRATSLSNDKGPEQQSAPSLDAPS